MDGFLIWLEASTLGAFIREAGGWAYAGINLAHVLGIGALFGAILILDLRLLGVGRRVALDALATAAVPVAGAGLVVALTTGVALLATNGSEYIGNPFLLIKFPAIGVGLLNVWLLGRTSGWRAIGVRELTAAENRMLARLGGVSLVAWTTAIAAGRLIAYW